MTVVNPSFEIESVVIGEPDSWDVTDNTAFVEVAEFGLGLGYDRFEIEWRLPLGLNIESGLVNSPKEWASITNAVDTIGAPPSSDFVAAPSVAVVTGAIPAGPDLVVTMTYVNELGVGGRTATATIPTGTTSGTDYAFILEGADRGFNIIQSLATSFAALAKIAVYGSHQLQPLNEGAKFEFSSSLGLDIVAYILAGGGTEEEFELGWSNAGGRFDNFDALLQEAASFDSATPEDFEDFEEQWNLPLGALPVTNESVLFGHENWLDGSVADLGNNAFIIVTGENDVIALKFTEGGTATDIILQLSPGAYSAVASKIFAVPGADLVDGETFTINDGINPIVTFEFDDDGSVVETTTLRAVNFTATAIANDVRDSITNAVNNVPGANLNIDATSLADGIVLLQNENFTLFKTTIIEFVADSGFVVLPELAREIENKIDAALDTDVVGTADSSHFRVRALPTGQIRLETTFAIPPGRPFLELIAPASDSVWTTLGFDVGKSTQRTDATKALSVANFGVSVPEPREDFEEEWKSNETSIFSLPDDANGVIAAADFGGPSPNTPEQFESGWVLVLP